MKEVIYKNRMSTNHKRRVISISEKSQTKDYLTHTHKTFIYIVGEPSSVRDPLHAPEYYVTKSYDTKTERERYYFRIKGIFYLSDSDAFLKVGFCHALKIDMIPKVKGGVEEKLDTKK